MLVLEVGITTAGTQSYMMLANQHVLQASFHFDNNILP